MLSPLLYEEEIQAQSVKTWEGSHPTSRVAYGMSIWSQTLELHPLVHEFLKFSEDIIKYNLKF